MGRIIYTDNYYAFHRALQDRKYTGSNYYPYKTPSIGTKFIDIEGTECSNIRFSYDTSETRAYAEANASLYYYLHFKSIEGGATAIRVGNKPASWSGVYDVPNMVTDYAVSATGGQTYNVGLLTYSPLVITITNNGANSITFNCIGQARNWSVFNSISDTTTTSTGHRFLIWAYELDSDVTLQPGQTYTFSINLPTTEFNGG